MCLIIYQATGYLAIAKVDANNAAGSVPAGSVPAGNNQIIRYFQEDKCADCQINPCLVGNLRPRIAVKRKQAFIPTRNFVMSRIM